MAEKKYGRLIWRGIRADNYMVQGLECAEGKAGFAFRYTQGGYNAGGVAASAGTHDGGGAVDIDVRGLSQATINKIVNTLRKCGWAAWHRRSWEGPWIPHVHAIQLGNAKASAGAKQQIRLYKAGRNGLVSNAPDHHWRPAKIRALKWNPGGKKKQKERTMKPLNGFPTYKNKQKVGNGNYSVMQTKRHKNPNKRYVSITLGKHHGTWVMFGAEFDVRGLPEGERLTVQFYKVNEKTGKISTFDSMTFDGTEFTTGTNRTIRKILNQWRKPGKNERVRLRMAATCAGVTVENLTTYGMA